MYKKEEYVISKSSGSKVAGSKNDKLRIPESPTQLWTHNRIAQLHTKYLASFIPTPKNLLFRWYFR